MDDRGTDVAGRTGVDPRDDRDSGITTVALQPQAEDRGGSVQGEHTGPHRIVGRADIGTGGDSQNTGRSPAWRGQSWVGRISPGGGKAVGRCPGWSTGGAEGRGFSGGPS